MYIIGIDVATKSLAISIIKYKSTEILVNEIEDMFNSYKISKEAEKSPNEILKNYLKLLKYINRSLDQIEILFIDVKDLIPDKKLKETNIIERTTNLFSYLSTIDEKIKEFNIENKDLIFLIEYQMGPNDKSRVISSQLLYHFTKYEGSRIELVGPSLKNSLYYKNLENSKYSYFLEKYSTNYSANKAHSKYFFLELIKILKIENIIDDIKKKNLDDVADSVLMPIAWLKKHDIL